MHKYDWPAIQTYYNTTGVHAKALRNHFGFAKATYDKAVARGDFIPRPTKIQRVLNDSGEPTNKVLLKKKLIEHGILKNKCAICNLQPMWVGQPLVLILDHINGIKDDNRLDNLRLVCPNCDSQLPTFAGRNAKRRRQLQQN